MTRNSFAATWTHPPAREFDTRQRLDGNPSLDVFPPLVMRRASFICKPCLWQIRQQFLPPRLPSQPCARQWSSTLGAGLPSSGTTKEEFRGPDTPDDSRIRNKKKAARRGGYKRADSFSAPKKSASKRPTPDIDPGKSLDYATIFGPSEPIPPKTPRVRYKYTFSKPRWTKKGVERRKRRKGAMWWRGRGRFPGVSSDGYYTASTVRQLAHLTHNTPPEDLRRAKRKFFAWKMAFHTIWTSLEKDGLPSLEAGGALKDDKNLLGPLLACRDPRAMRKQWRENDPALRKLAWPSLMLNVLRFAPNKAHEVLEATFDEDEIPFYAVRDVLNWLIQVYRLLPPPDKREVEVVEGPDGFERVLKFGSHIPKLVVHILRNSTPGRFQLSQDILYAAAVPLTPQKLLRFYKHVKRNGLSLGFWTLQQYASRFAKHSAYKTVALDLLRELVMNYNLDLSAPHGAALCTSILAYDKRSATDPKHQETKARLFEELLDLGLRPNRITFTAIIRNMALAKEVDRAWQLFEFMTSTGVEPDDQLYSILINGSKLSGDFEHIARTANMLTRQKLDNPYIWNDVIHTVYHAHIQAALESGHTSPKSVPAFPAMLEVYCKYFDPEPLQRVLSMYEPKEFRHDDTEPVDFEHMAPSFWIPKVAPYVESLQPREPQDRLQPDHITLAIMLCGYVKSLETSRDILIFYATFRQLLKAGDETAARIAAHGTAVHDAVILAITRFPGMLRVALDVLNDMLDTHTSGPLADSQPGTPAGLPHPKPSAHTWAALIKVLGFARQPDRAEQALRVMDGQGDEPDDAHWNTIAAGYARGQDIGGVISALRRRVAAGFPPDEYTVKAFGYLLSPGDAYEEMEAMLEARDRALAREEAERNEVLGVEGDVEGGERKPDREDGEEDEGGVVNDDDVL